MRTLLTIFILLLVVALAAAAFVWYGAFDVSARVPHWGITSEIIEQVRDRSIAVHSANITAPPMGDPALLRMGATVYNEVCLHCHAAPGRSPEPFALGLYPAPANLLSGSVQKEWTDKQLYWIVQNGLKMTGMPAFGVNYEEREMASVVTFLRRLPGMSAADYQEMTGGKEH